MFWLKKDFEEWQRWKCGRCAQEMVSREPTANTGSGVGEPLRKGVDVRQEFREHTKENEGDFPDGPVVKTLCSQCRGHGFNPWLGKILHAAWHGQKKKQRERENEDPGGS